MRLQLLNHFKSFLGADELVLSADGVEVHKWSDPYDAENVVLATVGMMEKRQFLAHGSGATPATELLMFCRPHDVRLIAQVLIDIADYPTKAKTSLGWWHVLPLGHPIVPNSRLRHLLFIVPPFEEGFSTFHYEGGRVNILWVVPIADGERAIFEINGVDELEQQLEEKDVIVADLFRDPIA